MPFRNLHVSECLFIQDIPFAHLRQSVVELVCVVAQQGIQVFGALVLVQAQVDEERQVWRWRRVACQLEIHDVHLGVSPFLSYVHKNAQKSSFLGHLQKRDCFSFPRLIQEGQIAGKGSL